MPSMVEAALCTCEWITSSLSPSWNAALAALPQNLRDVYLEPAHLRLYESEDAQANCFVYREQEEVFLYPFLMQRIPRARDENDISSPYGYGGPVSSTDDAAFVGRARARFVEEASRRRVVAELVRFHPLLENHRLMDGQMQVIPICPVVWADLGIDPDERWHKVYTHANRKNINKATRNGITVSFDADAEGWDAFERLYLDTMKVNAADAFYEFSRAYFRGIREDLPENHLLLTARDKSVIVAALLVLVGSENLYCHLIGTDRDALKYGVNNLLHHELILWGAANGYKRLLIGGGRGNDLDDSLLRFKQNFSQSNATFFIGESVLARNEYDQLCADWRAANPGAERSDRLLLYRQ